MNDNVVPLRGAGRDEIGRTCEGQVPDELLGRGPTCAGSVGPGPADDDELDQGTREIPDSVKARGIVDRATGIDRDRASRQWLQDAAWQALGRGGGGTLYTSHFLVMGLASSAAGLHDGVIHALETDNPFATYTLLRSYADNAALVLYATDHPDQLDRILGLGGANPIKVGTIKNYAEQGSKRFGAFRAVYDD
ncbi:MAG TPA: hypothetical protein VE197_21115, partial [Mycobacterium sp.]|nr:hypothetical protein [Mycobacterium sp.]